jgi:hypothetical protein
VGHAGFGGDPGARPVVVTLPVMLVRVPDGSDCHYVLANQCNLFNGR